MYNLQNYFVTLFKGEMSGDIHFDDDETWTLGSYSGINLTQVILDTYEQGGERKRASHEKWPPKVTTKSSYTS